VAPSAASLPRTRIRPVAPSRQSLLIGVGVLAVAAGAYAVARETSAFAVDRIEVRGAPPRVAAEVRHAVATLRGNSLLSLDGSALVRQVDELPSVVSAGYDRAFPHTLRIVVVPEQPVAVVRQGAKAWLVSARGRVMRPLPPHGAWRLARIWIPKTTPVAVGGFLPANHAAAIARSLALAAGFPAHVAFAALRRDGLVLRLRNGLELRLGDPTDVRLKLAIARAALRRLPAGAVYVDVSVPGRPVAGTNPQLSTGG
jgi:cell division protein FtsQ